MDLVTLIIILVIALKLFIKIDSYVEQIISHKEIQFIKQIDQELNEGF